MQEVSAGANATLSPSQNGHAVVPRLSGDIRHLIPKLGLREYWYPGVNAKEIGKRKPKKVRMLGEDLAFFRDKQGKVVALGDVCPHRGARLSEGLCEFEGTVTCPYHGWTFDGTGKNVAVLGEGPESKIAGKPGTSARTYPTQELRGIVFVWMGQGEPASIEEDVPEYFFQPDAQILPRIEYWPINWEVALENSMDAHVSYLHRNAAMMAMPGTFIPRGAQGSEPIWTGNGFTGVLNWDPKKMREADHYADLGWKWPKTSYRRLWGWLFKEYLPRTKGQNQRTASARWSGGHHLPGMFGAGAIHRPGIFGFMVTDNYIRMVVPVDEENTRLWYYHTALTPTRWERLLHILRHRGYVSWIHDVQFSSQDVSPMINQRYDQPETLSITDSEVVQWRRLVVTKHYGGREAPFQFNGKSLVGNEGLIGGAPPAIPHLEEAPAEAVIVE